MQKRRLSVVGYEVYALCARLMERLTSARALAMKETECERLKGGGEGGGRGARRKRRGSRRGRRADEQTGNECARERTLAGGQGHWERRAKGTDNHTTGQGAAYMNTTR